MHIQLTSYGEQHEVTAPVELREKKLPQTHENPYEIQVSISPPRAAPSRPRASKHRPLSVYVRSPVSVNARSPDLNGGRDLSQAPWGHFSTHDFSFWRQKSCQISVCRCAYGDIGDGQQQITPLVGKSKKKLLGAEDWHAEFRLTWQAGIYPFSSSVLLPCQRAHSALHPVPRWAKMSQRRRARVAVQSRLPHSFRYSILLVLVVQGTCNTLISGTQTKACFSQH
jgi:hypothetical protein